jgi:general secretion pathway protein D
LQPSAGTNPGAIVVAEFTNSAFPDITVANNLSGTAGMVTLLITPTSLISNPALTQHPYPGSEYVDIGLKVKATPSVHPDKEVTLQLEFEIKALTGSSFNGIPVISNRSVTQSVRLREDEPTILAGLLDREETNSLTGIPGLATLPGVGYLFGNRTTSFTDTEFLLVITPRRVRNPVHELRTYYAGRGDTGGGRTGPVAGPPPEAPPGPQPATTPAPAPGQPPPGEPAPVQPQPGQPPAGPPPRQPPQGEPPAQQPPAGQENPPPQENPQQPQPGRP